MLLTWSVRTLVVRVLIDAVAALVVVLLELQAQLLLIRVLAIEVSQTGDEVEHAFGVHLHCQLTQVLVQTRVD